MVPVFSVAGEQLLTIELSEFDAADGLCLEVAKSLDVASCKMISASGEPFTNSQLAEAKSHDDPSPLTAVVMIQDPWLRMIGFQDADGNLLAEASRSELRRIALVVGEKLLKATCNLIRPTGGQRAYRVQWPFEGVLAAPPMFAAGFCDLSPFLPVIPAQTRLSIIDSDARLPPKEFVAAVDITASEVITHCDQDFDSKVERELLSSDKAREMGARHVYRTATVRQYSAHEILIELGHDFLV